MRYTDEIEPLLSREQELRQAIAQRIAQEMGEQASGATTEDRMAAADAAIVSWIEEGEFEQDMQAFRPMGPLQTLLAEHRAICERIFDIRDRRLS